MQPSYNVSSVAAHEAAHVVFSLLIPRSFEFVEFGSEADDFDGRVHWRDPDSSGLSFRDLVRSIAAPAAMETLYREELGLEHDHIMEGSLGDLQAFTTECAWRFERQGAPYDQAEVTQLWLDLFEEAQLILENSPQIAAAHRALWAALVAAHARGQTRVSEAEALAVVRPHLAGVLEIA